MKRILLILLCVLSLTFNAHAQRHRGGIRHYINYNLGTTYVYKFQIKFENGNKLAFYTFVLGNDNQLGPEFHCIQESSPFDDNVVCVKLVYKFFK